MRCSLPRVSAGPASRAAPAVALAVFLCLGSPALARGQYDAPRFGRIGTEDGLAQGTALAVVQDGRGFLWIGTQAGLHRYDGRELKLYRAVAADSSSIPGDYIRTLLVDRSGTLWVGTDEGGFARYDRHEDSFVRQATAALASVPQHLGSVAPNVLALAELDSLLWVSTTAGLLVLDPSTGDARWPSLDEPLNAACTSLEAAPDGRLLVGCYDGTVHALAYERATGRLLTEGLTDFGAPVSAILHASDSVIVGTGGRGVQVVDPDLTDTRLLPLPEATGGNAAVVMAMARDRFDHLWVGTRAGLVQLAPGKMPRNHISHAADATSLSHSEITALYEDRTGVLWIGTFDGLSSVSPYRNAILRYTARTSGRGLLTSPGVTSIHAAPEGGLWIGSMGGDVSHIDLDGGRVRTHRPDGSPPRSTGGDIMSLDVDAGGDIWVTVWDRGIARISSRTGNVTQIFAESSAAGLRDALAIHLDHAGQIWVGSASGGLFTVDPTNRSVRPFADAIGATPFASTYVWPIREPSPGELWIGTPSARGGVHRITRERHVRSWLFDPASKDGLSAGRVLTLLNGSDGTVWVGTYEGLNRLDPQTGDVHVYGTAEGLPHEIVEGILEDNRGMIWVATDGGLARLDPDTGRIRVFHLGAGLQSEKFYANSAFKDERGRLYFGGPGGLTVVLPDLLGDEGSPAPTVALTQFSVLGRERSIDRWVSGMEVLDLGPRENFFTFRFAALAFVDPNHNRYRYRLDGLDADWIDSGTDGVANYTSVPPGRYTFLVSASNSEGVWSERALVIPLVVQPPFHRTWWFQSSLAFLLSATLFGAYRYRMHQIGRIAAVRQRIASELHDDIGANLSAIAMKAELVQRVLDTASSDNRRARDIERMARETTQKVREMIWVVRDEHDSLSRLVEHIRTSAPTLLAGVLDYEVSVSPTMRDRVIGMELRQDIYSCYKEALQNAMKHSGARRVTIALTHEDRCLVLRVTDDGKGFDPSLVKHGNGLDLMVRRASKHRAQLTVRSAPGEGTSVELRVSLG